MKLTVTDAGTHLDLPGGTKLLDMQNTGVETLYYGFENTVTAADGATQGMPLLPGETKLIAGKEVLGRRILFITAATKTTTLNYTRGA